MNIIMLTMIAIVSFSSMAAEQIIDSGIFFSEDLIEVIKVERVIDYEDEDITFNYYSCELGAKRKSTNCTPLNNQNNSMTIDELKAIISATVVGSERNRIEKFINKYAIISEVSKRYTYDKYSLSEDKTTYYVTEELIEVSNLDEIKRVLNNILTGEIHILKGQEPDSLYSEMMIAP